MDSAEQFRAVVGELQKTSITEIQRQLDAVGYWQVKAYEALLQAPAGTMIPPPA